jgi:hypothetical protein
VHQPHDFVEHPAMKNITLSADASLIEAARERARSEQTTLNEQFRLWLAAYAQTRGRMDRYDAVMRGLRGELKLGRKLGRESINER